MWFWSVFEHFGKNTLENTNKMCFGNFSPILLVFSNVFLISFWTFWQKHIRKHYTHFLLQNSLFAPRLTFCSEQKVSDLADRSKIRSDRQKPWSCVQKLTACFLVSYTLKRSKRFLTANWGKRCVKSRRVPFGRRLADYKRSMKRDLW